MRRVYLALFFVALFAHVSSWATQIPGTITLLNDSSYILTATVYTHSGNYLGQTILQPGEQRNFTLNLSSTALGRPGFPDASITPYRIVWTCSAGDVYSTCQDGAVGSLVRASGCAGQGACSPQKPPEAKPSPQAKKS